MTTHNNEPCDLCTSSSLERLYPVPGTARGLAAYICAECGLVQSLPRIDHVPRRSAFPDSGAGFGNIRYGKGFRTEVALKALARHTDLNKVQTCLDVGANRGSFLLALLEQAPGIQATALEPDERVVDAYKGADGITLVNERVENVDLGEGQYDLVYHCHTLEHQGHPLSSMKAVARSMKTGGILFLEVPNIDFLAGSDLVEEWFIDKHLYHYSADTLLDTVRLSGLEVLEAPNADDVTNLTIIARKPVEAVSTAVSARDYEINKKLVENYATTLQANQQRLKEGAARLTDYCRKRKVAIWGAGRIYTSIVDIGGFNPSLLCAVVGKTLHQYVQEMFGVAVAPPLTIKEAKPDTVLVASRLYFDEIRQELADIWPSATVLTLDDVLAGTIGEAA